MTVPEVLLGLVALVVVAGIVARIWAGRLFADWRAREFEALKVHAQGQAELDLAAWRTDAEDGIRRDAIARSQSVTIGKVTEHLAPYLPDFPYSPKDVRFIGSPIDLVVFDGLDEGALRSVLFIEVRTGSGTLSARERQVRDAIREGRVAWEELRVARSAGSQFGGPPEDGVEHGRR